MAKNGKGKKNNSNGGANNGGSSPKQNNNGGNNKGNNGGNKNRKGSNDGNGGNQEKGKVPEHLIDCRICNRKYHWESNCRENPLGIGKRNKESLDCRVCNGNHWEDQCRTLKGENGGNSNNNGGKGGSSNSGKCLAPNGEDISAHLPNGKFPSRPCSKFKVAAHWNIACEKDGFDPVKNPNPGGKKNDNEKMGVRFPDDESSGPIGSAYNEYHSDQDGMGDNPADTYKPLPDTRYGWENGLPFGGTQGQQGQSPKHSPQLPPVNFIPRQKQTQDDPNPKGTPYSPYNPNGQTNSHQPDYMPNSARRSYLTQPATANTEHPEHPDSDVDRAQWRSHNCGTCKELGHKTNDCATHLWLLPTKHPNWRPHSDLHHPSNAVYPRPNGYWKGNPMRVPSKNTYIWPHPQNTHQGRYWGENDVELGGVKDVWIDQDDSEGDRQLRWGMPPGGCGGVENGNLCQFDVDGDLVMVDILDLEWRRWQSKEKKLIKEQAKKPWWLGGPMDF
ncbi:hypothetical protein SBOR_5285 [Sclerotinia borealis F-4128]|uniref:CCHC-type domain-containing protein n=1 Tax=Sclerotinia borealis (strain F-4128) TaxID=1432307 RepID=W9CES8_SCLBF|nr:hypothetical protein SBOR_5285 [Sclerotinia borealis F-4128]